ncbi:hypothetical protein AB0O51_19180 [Streptomyces sp. NPDC090301]|uniref:hypothetical protein n=1 Tax=Streptomyces sp. NPDC090301 TaxID=3154975 RepID=UPI0034149CCA
MAAFLSHHVQAQLAEGIRPARPGHRRLPPGQQNPPRPTVPTDHPAQRRHQRSQHLTSGSHQPTPQLRAAQHRCPPCLRRGYDSEQTPWSAARWEAYANDQNSPDTLIAVSTASNRSKSDKDPAEWLPSDGSYHCTYAATWVGTKLRWDLAVDESERQALLGLAEDCPTTTVVYEPAL